MSGEDEQAHRHEMQDRMPPARGSGLPSKPASDDAAKDKDKDKDKAADGKDGDGPAKKKKRIPWWVWVLLAVLVLAGLLYWLFFVRGYEDTDDAYTDGHAVPIAAKVSGYVRQLPIRDNLRVKAGDLLMLIEPDDYAVAVAASEAQVAQARAQLDSARLELEINQTSQFSNLDSAKAARDQARANLALAQANLERQRAVDPLATTQQQTDQTSAQAAVQAQALRDAEAKVRTAAMAPRNVATYAVRVEQAEAQLKAAEAQLDQSRLNLRYTELRAPIDGFVTERSVELGSFVQPGTTLFTLVGTEVWITANYKENQLAHMRVQQPVSLRIDAFPDLELHGHVDSFQQGSGSRFSAFPAQNATGNFVKIVQRVPVKIVIDSGLDPNRVLPLGLSVVPTVDVR